MLTIKKITLLNSEELKEYKYIIPKTLISPSYDIYWWLRSEGKDPEETEIVTWDGKRLSMARYLEYDVCPVLKLITSPHRLGVGTEFRLFGFEWTVLDVKDGVTTAICNTKIACRRYDTESNDWETSELKAWLEEWIEYVTLGMDDVTFEP